MDYLSKLPDELLEEIFSYCKVLPLIQVCKRFEKLICGSLVLMQKLELVYSEAKVPTEIVKSKRRYQAIQFNFDYHMREGILEVLQAFEFKSLQLLRCVIDAELFCKFLRCVPSLVSLSVFTTMLKQKDSLHSMDKPQLPKLKSFNLRNSDIGFYEFLKNASIVKLSAAPAAQYPASATTKFLTDHPSITTLDPLLLKNIDDDLLVCLAQKMNNLKKLYIQDSSLVLSKCVKNMDLSNTTVQSLAILVNPKALPYVVSIFKNVKVLEIETNESLETAIIDRLQQILPHLESLSIEDYFGDYVNQLHWRNLKCIKLNDGAYTADEWTRFSNRHPLIEKIVLTDESMTDEVFRTICLEFRRLNHFEMYYDPEKLTPQVLDFICDQNFPGHIRKVKIMQRNHGGRSFMELSAAHKEAVNANLGFQLIFN